MANLLRRPSRISNQVLGKYDFKMGSNIVRRGNLFGQVRNSISVNGHPNELLIIEFESAAGIKQLGFFEQKEVVPVHSKNTYYIK